MKAVFIVEGASDTVLYIIINNYCIYRRQNHTNIILFILYCQYINLSFNLPLVICSMMILSNIIQEESSNLFYPFYY
jgi:hypothetical protein